jgi:hypothetical protein
MKRCLILAVMCWSLQPAWSFTKTNTLSSAEAGHAVSNEDSTVCQPFMIGHDDTFSQRGFVWFSAIPEAIQGGVVSQAVLSLTVTHVVTSQPVQVNAYSMGGLTYSNFYDLPATSRFCVLTGTLESAGVKTSTTMSFVIDPKSLSKKSQMGFALRVVPENRTGRYNFTAPKLRVVYIPYYAISIATNPPAGGTATGSGSYAGGASKTVRAYATSGYTFSNWTEGASVASTNAFYTFTVTMARTLTANFTKNPSSYTITLGASPAEGGTVSGAGTYAAGSSRTVYASPAAGYAFTNWTEGAGVVGTATNYTFALTANRTLTACFVLTQSVGVIRFKVPGILVGETAGSVAVRVVRAGGSFGPATVQYKTIGGTAVAGSDYQSRSGTLSWLAGEKGIKVFLVPIISDGLVESAESFKVRLSAATGAALGLPAKIAVTIAGQLPPMPGDAPVVAASPGEGLALSGSGTLSFRWQLETANAADAYLLMDNGEVRAALRGPAPWAPCAVDLPHAVVHDIRWVYVGDPNGASGAGAVDQVEWVTGD